MDEPLAEALALDSGSEVSDDEEDLTVEQLQELLQEDGDPQGDNDDEGQNEDDGLNLDFSWSEDYRTFGAEREVFREEVGPKIDGTSPCDLFCQLWDQPLLDMIVHETNRYAWQNIAMASESETGISAKSRINDWVETSVSELYRLIGVIITMGMCLRGRVDEYWGTGILEMPKFRACMSHNRFLLLMRFLHFADNDLLTARGEDRKVAKIQPLINYLNMKFKAAYSPRRELAIDESLLLWKGHLSWVQCIRTKAARFGIKSYELCESASGYVLDLFLYSGRTSTAAAVEAIFGFTSSTAKIVFRLLGAYLGKGYTLFMDNFYNSVRLCRVLKLKKTDVVGTLNRRRVDTPQCIKTLNEKRMGRGAVVGRHCGDVSVLSWKDVKLVTTVSTYHNADVLADRRAGQACTKPKVVLDYNKFMGGVDLKDQKLAMYLLERKRGLKWYIKVFKRLLNISILNTYIIYCSNIGQRKKLTHRQFRYQLAAELLQRFGEIVTPRTRSNAIHCDRLNRSLDHFPDHSEIGGDRVSKQNKKKRGRCTRCSANKKRTDTSVFCSQCKVYLCVGQCWREYHTFEFL